MLTKVSDFEYELEYAVGYHNEFMEINITKEGLEIGGDTFYWDQIKEAHQALFDQPLNKEGK